MALAFLVMPIVRVASMNPAGALSLIIGAAFFAAAAMGFGTLARTPKLFAGIAFLFLYVVMSSAGAAEFDFAGWNGVAMDQVRIA